MKATVTEDAAGLRWEIRDDGSEEYRKAVELTCCKPAAWMVKAPIGSILPLCHSRQEAENVAEKLTSESRIVPLYEYDEWSELKKAGEAASREEGYKVMEAEIAALHAENERLTAAWIPVGERLPDRYIRVLAFVKCEPHEHPHAIGFVGSTGLWSLDELHEPSAEITHWMPLPEPPEVK